MSTSPIVPLPPVEEAPVTPPRPHMAWEEITAYAVVIAGVLFVLWQQLVSALIVGLALYLILDRVSERFHGRMSRGIVRPLALLTVTTVTGAIITAAIAHHAAPRRGQRPRRRTRRRGRFSWPSSSARRPSASAESSSRRSSTPSSSASCATGPWFDAGTGFQPIPPFRGIMAVERSRWVQC